MSHLELSTMRSAQTAYRRQSIGHTAISSSQPSERLVCFALSAIVRLGGTAATCTRLSTINGRSTSRARKATAFPYFLRRPFKMASTSQANSVLLKSHTSCWIIFSTILRGLRRASKGTPATSTPTDPPKALGLLRQYSEVLTGFTRGRWRPVVDPWTTHRAVSATWADWLRQHSRKTSGIPQLRGRD